MKPILQVQNISKKYTIRHKNLPYETIIDSLKNLFKSDSSKEEFYALKNINFDIYQGEALGIIGRNGAGKSTLLKILSRITYPSDGKVKIRGRIASLLEVGTGFHPELSGRENIFLNGSILGLKRKEIIRSFDEIVDFSGVEKFLDTPLKHYSSGMQLRLAFAVAAHLNPEILIIDEVLAVGDSDFQKKCIGKMEEVTKSDRTIIFVSHNLTAVANLCNKGIILHNGEMNFMGAASEAINYYINNFVDLTSVAKNKSLNKVVTDIQLFANEQENKPINPFDSLKIRFKLSLPDKVDNLTIGFIIKNHVDTPVLGVNNLNYGIRLSFIKESSYEIDIKSIPLTPGYYSIDLIIGNGISTLFTYENIIHMTVVDKDLFIDGREPDPKMNSFILKEVQWKVN